MAKIRLLQNWETKSIDEEIDVDFTIAADLERLGIAVIVDPDNFSDPMPALVVSLSGNPSPNPDYIDTTSTTVVYEGYKSGTTMRICKIDLSTQVITRTWASGAWVDRSILTYA